MAIQSNLIQKEIVRDGNGDLPEFKKGTKTTFHFKTVVQDDAKTVLDDSKAYNKPMELLIGKKFKLEVWEKIVTSMRVGEVAQFTVHPSLVSSYPVVAKSLREYLKGSAGSGGTGHHSCTLSQMTASVGHPDLDWLLKNPRSLAFTIDLLSVELPGEYHQEAWAMTDKEKADAIPRLREEGNQLYKQGEYGQAELKYFEAIGILEQLKIKEKRGEREWEELEDLKVPLLLNYSQCKLLQNDYYEAIEHTTTVLEREPDNVKALFRRAKAYLASWSLEEARGDFIKAVKLDSTLRGAVTKELAIIEERKRQKEDEDKQKFKGMFFK